MYKYFLFIGILGTSLLAGPAYPGWRSYEQPSGEIVKIQKHGDEYMHWSVSKDNTILVFNKNSSSFDVAKISNDKLVTNGTTYSKLYKTRQSPSFHKEVELLHKTVTKRKTPSFVKREIRRIKD